MPSKQVDDERPGNSSAAIIAEYSALRQEILARSQAQNQIITISLLVSGTLLTLGLTHERGSSAFLVLPAILFFLALGWSRHDLVIKRIGGYQRYCIESRVCGIGWEEFLQKVRTNRETSLKHGAGAVHVRGLFVTMEVLALTLALSEPTLGLITFDAAPQAWVLFVVSLLSAYGTWKVIDEQPIANVPEGDCTNRKLAQSSDTAEQANPRDAGTAPVDSDSCGSGNSAGKGEPPEERT